MKRHSFLKLALVTGWVTSLPAKLFARQDGRAKTGFKVTAGKDRFDRPLSPFKGDAFFRKVSGADNDGQLFIFESTRNSEGGPLLHTHFDQDEFWYVLEGSYLIKVGDVLYEANKGDFVYGPKKIPHTFSKIGDGPGKLMVGFHPAGKIEEYFLKLNDGSTTGITEEQREIMRREHGFETAGPAIKVQKKYTH